MRITDVNTVTVGHHSGMPSATFSRASPWQDLVKLQRAGFDLTKLDFAKVEIPAALALP